MPLQRILLVLIAPLLATGGCARPSDPPPPKSSGTAAETQEVQPVPPLESLPIARDAQAQSPAAEIGTTPGQLLALTPLKIPFCWCPPGTFPMGSLDDEPNRMLNETRTSVTLSQGYWLQQTEVTQAQYEAVMGVNPSHHKGSDNPVDSVTWDEATQFCQRLSSLASELKAGNVYRLPTEAEWEYACRAGTLTSFSHGNDEDQLGEYAWFSKNSDRTTHPVALKKPNSWKLHDMHGNVAEWCQDWYGTYPENSAADPKGAETGDKRIIRGGGWFFVPMYHRSAYRDAFVPTARYVGLGFRVAVSAANVSSEQPAE